MQDSIGIGKSVNNTGLLYKRLGDCAPALDAFTQSFAVSEAINNKRLIATTELSPLSIRSSVILPKPQHF